MLVAIVYWFVAQMSLQQNSYSYQEFMDALNQGQIQSVVIEQNKAVPTGTLELSVEGEDGVRYLSVTDVNEAQEILKEAGVTKIHVMDVPEDSWLMTTLFPTLLTIGVIVVLFSIMNRQGGGANAKAMNFGKNRARMTNPSEKQITFE